MEKSIEKLWKEAFLDKDALIAPRINNLYNRKSKHIVDKFNRMFKINLNAIVGMAIFLLIISYFANMPYLGISFFPLLIGIVIVNKKLHKSLSIVDKTVNSYEYLKTFDSWLESMIKINVRMARFYYPYFFLAMIFSLWFSIERERHIGEILVEKLLKSFPDMQLVFGIPILFLIILIVIPTLLVLAGEKIYRWEINLVYGAEIRKLKEMLSDMEELRS